MPIRFVLGSAVAFAWIVSVGAGPGAARGQPDREVLNQGAHRVHLTAGPLHSSSSCHRCHLSEDIASGKSRPAVSLEGFQLETKRCAGTHCHGGFAGGNAANAPVWEPPGPAAGACGSCHDTVPRTGAHGAHTRPEGYALGCATCHDDPSFPQNHANGEVEVRFRARRGLEGVYGSPGCSRLYCHSDGRGNHRPAVWCCEALAS